MNDLPTPELPKTIRFPQDDVHAVERICRMEDLDFSKFVRRAVRNSIKQATDNTEKTEVQDG